VSISCHNGHLLKFPLLFHHQHENWGRNKKFSTKPAVCFLISKAVSVYRCGQLLSRFEREPVVTSTVSRLWQTVGLPAKHLIANMPRRSMWVVRIRTYHLPEHSDIQATLPAALPCRWAVLSGSRRQPKQLAVSVPKLYPRMVNLAASGIFEHKGQKCRMSRTFLKP
jgi:hypothetical protein